MTRRELLAGAVVSICGSEQLHSQESAPPYPIVFHLAEAGSVSVAVYDSQQRMLRELARGVQLDPGDHRLNWDGLDRYGHPAPPGEYEWRLLRTPGFTREFLVSVGTNITWAPFDLWPGNHTGPERLLIDGDSNLYIGAIWSEGPPNILKLSMDGRQKFWSAGWGIVNPPIGMARVGSLVYALLWDGAVDVLDAESGRVRTRHFADLIHPADPEAGKKPGERKPGPHNELTMAFAGSAGFLMVTYLPYDEVRFFQLNPDGARLRKSIRLSQPKGCCICPDGRVFVVSGRSVVRIDPESGEVQPAITDSELTSPVRVAWDRANDDLLVLQRGPGVDHVRRYHAPSGKLVASYGRSEGRLWGPFNPLDFSGLFDIAADGQGGFFTAEECPRRVAHFRGRERHELVAQWVGGMQWGTLCALDPQDLTTVYLFPDYKHCARGRIDYATRSWTLTHVYDVPEEVTVGKGSSKSFCAYVSSVRRVVVLGGATCCWFHIPGERWTYAERGRRSAPGG